METDKLIEAYIKRSDAHAAKIETEENSGSLTPPSFVKEVIIPLITALAEDMPGYDVVIPNPVRYHMLGDLYRIKVGLVTVGGISVWDEDEIRLHYVRLSHAKPIGEPVKITGTKELAQIIKSQLITKK